MKEGGYDILVKDMKINTPCPSSLKVNSRFSLSFSFFPRRRFLPPCLSQTGSMFVQCSVCGELERRAYLSLILRHIDRCRCLVCEFVLYERTSVCICGMRLLWLDLNRLGCDVSWPSSGVCVTCKITGLLSRLGMIGLKIKLVFTA